MTILAGDIGGTKTNLALFSKGEFHAYKNFKTYHSADFADLNTIVADYLKTTSEPIERACYAVAGPVVEGISKITNLPWTISVKELIKTSGISNTTLINDLLAGAYSIDILPPESLHELHKGEGAKTGNVAIVAPGTGLGEAGLIWENNRFIPFASEGGHSDFGPETQIQLELASYLFNKIGHLSYDRLLSGPGFSNLYQFFIEAKQQKPPEWLVEELKTHDHGATITHNALNGKSPLCEQILDLYLEIFGQECSNVALKFMAIGGIYLGGGIPPKILPRLKSSPDFLKGYRNKGRFRSFVEKIPVQVILDDKANLKGAARFASLRS